jgi:hypothetical protein
VPHAEFLPEAGLSALAFLRYEGTFVGIGHDCAS